MTAKKTRIKNIVTSPKGRTMLVKKPKLPIGIAAVIAGVLILVGGLYVLLSSASSTAYPKQAVIGKTVPYTSFWWQLEGSLNVTGLSSEPNPKKHYDCDFEDVTAANITTIKSQGALVTCYFEVGSAAQWRDDYAQFPESAMSGTAPNNWDDERWVDISNQTVRGIMQARMDASKSKGCQGIEPDWLDNYTYSQKEYDSTEKIKVPTKAQELDYMRFLADEAHKRGMMIALKNVPDLAIEKFSDGQTVADVYDWALIEECTPSYASTCPNLKAFVDRGKAVVVAEYNDQLTKDKFTNQLCSQYNAWNFDAYLFDRSNGGSPTLTGKFRVPCRTGAGQVAVPTTTTTVFPAPSTFPTVTTTVTPTPTVTTTVTPSSTPTPNNNRPVGPASLSATAVSSSQVNLAWPVATDDSSGALNYVLTRNGMQIYSGAARTFTDAGLTASTSYSYKVIAVDVGLLSSVGATATAKTLDALPPTADTTKPSAPSSVKGKIELDATRFSYFTNLTWSPSFDNVGVTRYEVKRNNVILGTSTTSSFKDYNLQPNTLYTYDIYAKDAAGNASLPGTARLTGRCFLIWCWSE